MNLKINLNKWEKLAMNRKTLNLKEKKDNLKKKLETKYNQSSKNLIRLTKMTKMKIQKIKINQILALIKKKINAEKKPKLQKSTKKTIQLMKSKKGQ